jgi:hypothetical protein
MFELNSEKCCSVSPYVFVSRKISNHVPISKRQFNYETGAFEEIGDHANAAGKSKTGGDEPSGPSAFFNRNDPEQNKLLIKPSQPEMDQNKVSGIRGEGNDTEHTAMMDTDNNSAIVDTGDNVAKNMNNEVKGTKNDLDINTTGSTMGKQKNESSISSADHARDIMMKHSKR